MNDRPRTLPAFAVGTVAAALDLLTKWWAYRAVPLGVSHPVLGDWLLIHPRSNPAGPWSWGHDSVSRGLLRFLLPALSVVAVIILLRILGKTDPKDRVKSLGLALILGGAAGNLWDRALTAFRPEFGGVRDFILVRDAWFQWANGRFVRTDFPAFNLADTWITIGVVFVGWRLLFEKEAAPAPPGESTTGESTVPGGGAA